MKYLLFGNLIILALVIILAANFIIAIIEIVISIKELYHKIKKPKINKIENQKFEEKKIEEKIKNDENTLNESNRHLQEVVDEEEQKGAPETHTRENSPTENLEKNKVKKISKNNQETK